MSHSILKTAWLYVVMSVPAWAQMYNEPFRAQFHFSPAKNWTNDPNGLVFYKGEYHLFYQYNPFGDLWGHMSWGHAVSPDMLHWQHLPVALPEENGVMIFSGSAVVDWNNTSGLCRNPDPKDRSCLVAVYTGRTEEKQAQNIAFSNDRGRTWTKYQGNPVLDLNLKDFRDPKVFWHAPSKQWIMVAVLAREKKVRFFGSRDLKRWEALSDFGPAGSTEGVWECPDLFPLTLDGDLSRTKWVLEVDVNTGAPAGGSGGQYFVGSFDGKTFSNDNPASTTLWQDFGKDFYASTSFSDIPERDGRRIWIAWMSNCQYARQEPTTPFRGIQSLPRVLKLRTFGNGVRLVQEPVSELERLRGKVVTVKNASVDEVNRRLSAVHADSYELVADIDVGAAEEAGFQVRNGREEYTAVGVRSDPGEVYIDRAHSGATAFHNEFPGRHAGPLPAAGRTVRLRVFVDRSSVELFAGDGRITISDRIFPSADSDGIAFFSKGSGARVISLELWPLASIWK
jgi:fructan beta-fructosidase